MLRDRVALGCIYLNDRSVSVLLCHMINHMTGHMLLQLRSYLVNETCNVINDGKIEGLFLTGKFIFLSGCFL